jgi:hypothetical protein
MRSKPNDLTLTLAGLVAASVGYIALVFIGPIDLPWQGVSATMQLEPTVEGNTVRVVGTTDLPDGAVIDYSFWRDDAVNEGPAGAVEVLEGKFAFERDMTGQRRGRWDIEASFSTVWGTQQPKHVTDLFGAEGEHLAGPQVYVDSPGDAKQLLVTTSVTLP